MPRRFDFEFEPRFRALLAAIGVTPARAYVELDDERVRARFGAWCCESPVDNIVEVSVTGPYRWFRAIGARGSFADRGLTFGTTTAGGVCARFREPVRGLEPTGRLRHPGLTVTVADRAGFAAALRQAAGVQ